MELIPENNLLKKPGLLSQEFKSGFKTEELDSLSRKEKNRGGLRTKTVGQDPGDERIPRYRNPTEWQQCTVTVLFLWSQEQGKQRQIQCT